MSIYLSNRDGNGKTNEEGHYRLQTRVFEGAVLHANDLLVKQNSPLALSVLVSVGDYRLETASGYSYTGWIDADTAVTITTANPSNPRITSIVLYIDKGATTSASPPNNPGIAKLMAVNGTAGASPTAPSGSTIQTAVGSGNPYMKLADVLVGTAATQVTNSNITDARTFLKITQDVIARSDLLSVVGPLLYPIGSIYINATNSTNPATLLGFGTWVDFGAGRVPIGYDNSQTEFDTLGETGGEKTHVLTASEMPVHTHGINQSPHGHGVADPGHSHSLFGRNLNNGDGVGVEWNQTFEQRGGGVGGSGTGISIIGNYANLSIIDAGGGAAHNNLQPYVVVRMWRRTA